MGNWNDGTCDWDGVHHGGSVDNGDGCGVNDWSSSQDTSGGSGDESEEDDL